MDGYDILILGGGASGLAAAIEAAQSDVRVCVLEKLDRVGKKILATGNGRCNLLNLHASPVDYNDPRAVQPVLWAYDVRSNLDFFHALGLLTAADAEGRVYPRSYAASSVLDVLRLECARLGVEFRCGEAAETLQYKDNLFVVNGTHRARAVIVSCGGQASPAHGSDGSGYALLRAFGHTVTPLRPALVQIRTAPDLVRRLKGLRVQGTMRLTAPDGAAHEAQGEILFTDYGLSGIAAMELSRWAKEGCTAQLDLLPEMTLPELTAHLQFIRARDEARPLEQFLTGVVHSRVGQAVLQDTLHEKLSVPCAALTDYQVHAVARTLKCLSIPVLGTKGFPDAQVTAGGVPMREFTQSLESKNRPGLFACGEILDVDGKCGGYNLTFAWSSGRMAGRNAAEYVINSNKG